jgi:hypothetical protein
MRTTRLNRQAGRADRSEPTRSERADQVELPVDLSSSRPELPVDLVQYVCGCVVSATGSSTVRPARFDQLARFSRAPTRSSTVRVERRPGRARFGSSTCVDARPGRARFDLVARFSGRAVLDQVEHSSTGREQFDLVEPARNCARVPPTSAPGALQHLAGSGACFFRDFDPAEHPRDFLALLLCG